MTEQTNIGQTENGSADPQGFTGSARYLAERKPMVSWAALLNEAVDKPGFIHEAYSRFHNYSLGNQLMALFQCFERGIQPGPRHFSEVEGTWPIRQERLKSNTPLYAPNLQAHQAG